VVLRGHGRARLGCLLVPPNPFGVTTAPRAFRERAVPPAEAVGQPSMNFRSSSELNHRDPAPSRRPSPEGNVRLGRRRFLSWTFGTLRHNLRPADPHSTADPSAAAYRVRGLVTPFATSTTGPPGANECSGASLGFTLQGFLLDRDRYPSRGPCLPDVTRRPCAPPKGGGHAVAVFKALFSRRVRAVTRTTSDSGRRSLLGVRPSRVCSRST
jgi:hypothetical protein